MRFVPATKQPLAEHLRELAEATNLLIQGRGNYTGKVTLSSGTTSTTISNSLAHSGSVLTLMPLDANGQGVTWYATPSNSSILVTHDAPAGDAVFAYSING